MTDAIRLFVYIMSVFGFAYVVGNSKATQAIREWIFNHGSKHASPIVAVTTLVFIAMIECPACLGFHIGWIVGAWWGLSIFNSITLGFFTAATNLVLGKLTRIM